MNPDPNLSKLTPEELKYQATHLMTWNAVNYGDEAIFTGPHPKLFNGTAFDPALFEIRSLLAKKNCSHLWTTAFEVAQVQTELFRFKSKAGIALAALNKENAELKKKLESRLK